MFLHVHVCLRIFVRVGGNPNALSLDSFAFYERTNN